MNLKPPSEKQPSNKLLLYVILTVFATAFIFTILTSHPVRWAFMTRQERIEDTTLANAPDTLSSSTIDSTEIVQADRLLVDSLELYWGADRVNIKNALDNIAGVEGSVDWTISYDEARIKNSPDLFTAFAHAVNKGDKKPKVFDLTVLVNRRNKRFKILKAVNEGKVLKGPMIIMSLAIEGGYSQGVSF